ncbi:hypothetical protein [Thiohalophilus sp.]|uniref:hypothetical protein n=1 Tax=Thiohalophilus sp. TaxID=3028392 RepID=UPI002ACD6A73|nr:hypothetical protein [Thiohalophilus sp.]MDZ7660971.1 hypothetical protein [Thiohalophilus sp.]
MQSIAWYTSLVLILLLSAIFITVLRRSRDSGDATEVARRAYRPRSKLFAVALAAGVVITATTLLPWPHQLQAGADVDRVVEASARQWSWTLSDDRARVGERIEFQVYPVASRLALPAGPGALLRQLRHRRSTEPGIPAAHLRGRLRHPAWREAAVPAIPHPPILFPLNGSRYWPSARSRADEIMRTSDPERDYNKRLPQ